MPSATERIEKLREETEEGEIPYYSKSRVKKYKTCPRQFYHTYIEGKRGEETDAMRQGTRIHEVFEDYYANVVEVYGGDGKEEAPFPPTPEYLSTLLPDDILRWADWREFMANFLVWEIERAKEALDWSFRVGAQMPYPASETPEESAIRAWLPVGIEEEAWHDDTEPPWMGFADVLVNSSTVPEIDSDTGIVIVDFKTGKTPKKQYREDGIFLEGDYYGLIFEDNYEVDGVAGYYPKNGDFIVSDLSAKRRDEVRRIINEINDLVEEGPNKEDFVPDSQPLCKWGESEEDQCDFYGECPSTWGVPAEKRELLEQMVDNGNTAFQIADYMECEVNEVYYWARKFDLEI